MFRKIQIDLKWLEKNLTKIPFFSFLLDFLMMLIGQLKAQMVRQIFSQVWPPFEHLNLAWTVNFNPKGFLRFEFLHNTRIRFHEKNFINRKEKLKTKNLR